MISIGDALALCTLAIKAYEAWDDAPREFSDVIDSLLQLERILHRVNNVAKDDESLLDIEELSLYLRPPCETLSELNSIVEQYREMRSWNRINLACRDLGPIRTRLSQNYTTLNTYLTIIGVGSLTKMQPTLSRMELQSQDMYAIMTELNSGVKGLKRSGTVMSRYEGDNTGIWKSMRTRCISRGIRSDTIEKYGPQIEQYMYQLAAQEQQEAALQHVEESMEERWQECEQMYDLDEGAVDEDPINEHGIDKDGFDEHEADEDEADEDEFDEDETDEDETDEGTDDELDEDGRDVRMTCITSSQIEGRSIPMLPTPDSRNSESGHERRWSFDSDPDLAYEHDQPPDEVVAQESYTDSAFTEFEVSRPRSGWKMPWIRKRVSSRSRRS